MIGHFSAGQLASYRAGAVSDGRAARISSHLSNCQRCAQVDNDLTGVSQLLASVPIPAIPDHLTERLQSTLAAEVAQRAGGAMPTGALGGGSAPAGGLVISGSGGSGHAPGRPDRPGRARRRRVRQPRMTGWSSPLVLRSLAATATVALLVGGGLLFANAGGGRSGNPSAQSEPARRTGRVGAQAPRSNASALTPTQLQYQHDGKYAYTNVVTTDTSYTKENLAAKVRLQVASSASVGSRAEPFTGQARAPHHQLGHFDVGRLESCVSAVAAGQNVMLVDVARYMGVPAAIIVMRPVNGAFGVIVVGQACGASGQDVIARLTVPQH